MDAILDKMDEEGLCEEVEILKSESEPHTYIGKEHLGSMGDRCKGPEAG